MVSGPARPRPIEDYAMIGDLHTAALVSRTGSIDWLCLPRFDSPACFAAILHDERAGSWRLRPDGATEVTRREYVGHSLVLRSRWEQDDGVVEVLDFMPPRGEAADVVRIATCERGRVAMTSTLRLRFDYGNVEPWISGEEADLTAIAGPDTVRVLADVPMIVDDGTLHCSFTLDEGESVAFVATHQASHRSHAKRAEPRAALDDTLRFWEDWVGDCAYDGRWEAEVRRALVLLKGLTYAPSGGIVAAATTSLPEELGGVRNWDYRYCWLRDAAFTLQALLGAGFVSEAKAWRQWLVRAVAGDPAQLQIMYGVDGTRRLPELELPWLAGYHGSAPVRQGNEAVRQLQLDVWGEVLDGLHLARETALEPTDTAWNLQVALLDWLEKHWHEPDNGLWEGRGPRRHYVHSKVMAWVGLDRAVLSVEEHGLPGPVDRWRRLRDEIHDDVCRHGFDEERGTFTQFYGSEGLDAALLLIPRVGFLPWDDPRVVGTVDAVRRELCHDGFVRRYDPRADGGADGLPGTEGVFLVCSFWLVDALHGIGRVDEAEELFERLVALRNDVGMLSEEYDPAHRRHLGNTPQAFSLVGLVNSARLLSGGTTQTGHRRTRQICRETAGTTTDLPGATNR
ncbi:glycoside hydrolase family 15 protein [Nocardioides ginsengisoli]|uniref:Glycoside hydrolase family 15 protein n=1 Tax=Nocardioides ginsengisoli TaxID=363868 RepID=A0ABW3W3Z2_9ACTN